MERQWRPADYLRPASPYRVVRKEPGWRELGTRDEWIGLAMIVFFIFGFLASIFLHGGFGHR